MWTSLDLVDSSSCCEFGVFIGNPSVRSGPAASATRAKARLMKYEIFMVACARSDLLRVRSCLSMPEIDLTFRESEVHHTGVTLSSPLTRVLYGFCAESGCVWITQHPSVLMARWALLCVQVWVCVFAQWLRPAFDKHLWEKRTRSVLLSSPSLYSRSSSAGLSLFLICVCSIPMKVIIII